MPGQNLRYVSQIFTNFEQSLNTFFQVSTKLRAAYETDLQAMAPQSVMFPGLHPAAMMSTVGLGTGHPAQQAYNRNQGYMPSPGLQGAPRPAPPQVPLETSYLYIPNAAVGAIIGQEWNPD